MGGSLGHGLGKALWPRGPGQVLGGRVTSRGWVVEAKEVARLAWRGGPSGILEGQRELRGACEERGGGQRGAPTEL